MRSLEREKQKIWFCKITEDTNSIDNVTIYGKPEMHKLTVSTTSGTPQEIAAGIVPEYDRYITSYDREFNPEEGTMIFVDVSPKLDIYGNLALEDDGITPVTSPDYVLKKVLDTKNGQVARYGISKV